MAGLLHPLGCFAEATLHCPYPAHRHSQARLALGLHPCGWGHLATHPAVTQPWRAAHCSRPCGDKAVPSRRTCRPPRTPALFSWVGVEGREALTVARQAGPAAAAVGSRSLAAPAPPPRAESPRPTGRRPVAPTPLRLRRLLHFFSPTPPPPPSSPRPPLRCVHARALGVRHAERSSALLCCHRNVRYAQESPRNCLALSLACHHGSSVMLFSRSYPGFAFAAVTSLLSIATTTLLLLSGPQRLKPATFSWRQHNENPDVSLHPGPPPQTTHPRHSGV